MSKRYANYGLSKKNSYHTNRSFGNQKRSRFNNNTYQTFLPIFEPSGLLALESHNKQGIQLKHIEPPDSVSPLDYYNSRNISLRKRTRFEAILYKKTRSQNTDRNDDIVKTWNLLEKASYIIGRQLGHSLRKNVNEDLEKAEDSDSEAKEVVVADIGLPEEAISKQHAVIQFREKDNHLVPYVMDLNSSNGTLLNGTVLPSARYIQLWGGDVLEFSENETYTDYELVFVAV
ncbi:HHL011Wp [Eremothecium sinecaudum]|uniref:HHL011Wp n=1 Tax=Eremothecium sinecaudum TaxID=45286 RepID=A0A0X8HWG2_9SACH|nr:HHL011Wp [Eremothecium sinecaudum]AMD22759.1 HHL011Wp [Eremothecium sinecaudum]